MIAIFDKIRNNESSATGNFSKVEKKLNSIFPIGFEFNNMTFSIRCEINQQVTFGQDNVTKISLSTFDSSQRLVGKIMAEVVEENGKMVCTAKRSDNTVKGANTIHGIVRESIRQMVLQKCFDVWKSSPYLETPGLAMYQRMRNNADITVTMSTSGAGEQFTITKK